MEYILGYLFIFLAKCADITLATIRTLFVVRGKKTLSFFIGIVEILIYLFAINKVLSNMDNFGNVLSYALGFATGNVLGIMVESRIAIGLLTAQIFTSKDVEDFSDYLRKHEFGVTVVEGRGKEGTKHILQVVLDRKTLNKFEKCINSYDPLCFVTISDVKTVKGGYFLRNKMR
jgi:uncharacterized protein YebE (UPF0316 family)